MSACARSRVVLTLASAALAVAVGACARRQARQEVVYVAPPNVLVIANDTGFSIDRIRVGDCGTAPDAYRVATTGVIEAGTRYDLPLQYMPACCNLILEHLNRDGSVRILGHQTGLSPPPGTVWEVRR
jgi:hypothetical protein